MGKIDYYEVKKGITLHLLPSALKEKNFLSPNSELPTTNLNQFSSSFNSGKLSITLSLSHTLSLSLPSFIFFSFFSSPTSSQAGRGGAAPRVRHQQRPCTHRPCARTSGEGARAGLDRGERWEEEQPRSDPKGGEI